MSTDPIAAGTYDESLRSACGKPASLAVYDRSTLEIVGHACSMAHVLPGFGVIAPCGTYSARGNTTDMAPEHRTEVLTSHSTWKPSDSAQAFCTCGWHGYTYDGFDGAANVERSVAEALAHFAMPVVANGRIYRPEAQS
jgi:hypothetical protein